MLSRVVWVFVSFNFIIIILMCIAVLPECMSCVMVLDPGVRDSSELPGGGTGN